MPWSDDLRNEVLCLTELGTVEPSTEELPQATLEKWKAATLEACAAAYAPYRQGTIYPQMVVGCDDRLNRVLLE